MSKQAAKKQASSTSAKPAKAVGTPRRSEKPKPLCKSAEEALDSYFELLNGHKPMDLHRFFMGQVEKPLLRAVLDYTNGNQSTAAEILGLSRGTLRKKLQTYGLMS